LNGEQLLGSKIAITLYLSKTENASKKVFTISRITEKIGRIQRFAYSAKYSSAFLSSSKFKIHPTENGT
jgi:hypothetical protein